MLTNIFIPSADGTKAKCLLCGVECDWLGDHLTRVHDATVDLYLEANPGAATVSHALHAKLKEKEKNSGKVRTAVGSNPTIDIGGVKFPINTDVPAEACLPLPAGYRYPKFGELTTDMRHIVVSVAAGRSIWVSGPPGTGKDAFFSYYSAITRTPGLFLQVVQGADLQSWKYSRSFTSEGTMWEEGLLLKALRDGYRTTTGRVLPYLVVLSDIDRATRQQMEELRSILDSIQGRITGPDGRVYNVLPGTVIVATANSTGGGDSSGRCISANPVDASILDRFERAVQLHHMANQDEEEILRAKFPVLNAKNIKYITTIVKCLGLVRSEVAMEKIFFECSHRTACAWAGHAQDLLQAGLTDPRTILKDALRAVLDRAANPQTREDIRRVCDPHISGGVI